MIIYEAFASNQHCYMLHVKYVKKEQYFKGISRPLQCYYHINTETQNSTYMLQG